ncbi:MAG: T9SS type A sorting domain-containing protein, partial [Candidatus Kapabacteria bacterium]|nr:T9SS type A sorting domain-containing protein [Candidatus Kapabacteria bacterium]
VFSDSGSIGRFDGKVWKFYNSTQTGIKALGMDIRIVSDTSGRIWLRSNSQISYFDSTWHQITNISPDLLDAEGIYAQNDIIWLGGKGALIKLVNGSPTAINLPSFAGDYIGTIGIDSHDNKWLLTYRNNSSIPYLTIYREGGVIGNFVFVDSQNKSVLDSSKVNFFSASPNPFNSQLAISYTLPQPAQTALSLCDIQGNEVAIIAPEQQSEGTVNLYYDASALPAGTYLLTLRVGGQAFSKKIIKM